MRSIAQLALDKADHCVGDESVYWYGVYRGILAQRAQESSYNRLASASLGSEYLILERRHSREKQTYPVANKITSATKTGGH